MKKGKYKQVLIDGIVSFFYWSICLTPYQLIVLELSLEKYELWLLQQLIIVPPLGAIFAMIARAFAKTPMTDSEKND